MVGRARASGTPYDLPDSHRERDAGWPRNLLVLDMMRPGDDPAIVTARKTVGPRW